MSKILALADVGSATNNAAITLDGDDFDLWVQGTFVGTIQPEISADGTNFVALGSTFTVPTRVAIPNSAQFVRIDVTAYTSGTVESIAAAP